MSDTGTDPKSSELSAAFGSATPLTVGLEEEVMLLDADSLDLAPVAREVLAGVGGDGRFKLELPASQIEIVTRPHPTVPAAVGELVAARRTLLDHAPPGTAFACAGYHPFAAPEGELILDDPRRAAVADEYGRIARRQLVCALQVHVAVGDADATIAVHDALRSYLPELAALAANAPFAGGRDSGLASVRPIISGMLPRQGVPPALESLDRFADVLRWGRETGAFPDPRRWWWELRPNAAFGTLELRVPDAQTTVEDAAAVAAVAHALVVRLFERHAAGERLPVHDRWRIEENRWSASRLGLEGELADLDTGRRRPARERLEELVTELAPVAARLQAGDALALAWALIGAGGGAGRQRAAAREGGAEAAARHLEAGFRPERGDVFAREG